MAAEWIAVAAAVAAVCMAYVSWITSRGSYRAAILKERFEVFEAAREYIQRWQETMYAPSFDSIEARNLNSAKLRAKFLFGPEVEKFLGNLWGDGIVCRVIQ